MPTNEYAKLTTVDSAGTTGSTFDFEVPTVSYTITNDTLSYDANGGTGSMNPVTGNEGSTVTIAESGFTRSGYTFTGWNTQADGKGASYKAGDSFTLAGKDTVLYAQWSKKGSGKHSKSSKSSNSSEIGGNSSETVKPINSPHTGDNNHLLTWVLLLIISGCAVIGMVLYSRKKNRKAE